MRSIATRTGDDGTTSLLYGQRVPKDHPQIQAVGALDELNVELGCARALCDPEHRLFLASAQALLIALMGEVSCDQSDAARYLGSGFAKVTEADLKSADDLVADLEKQGFNLGGWATPGSNPVSAAMDRARVSARRAERQLAAVAATGRILQPVSLKWINRLSDLLWLLARKADK